MSRKASSIIWINGSVLATLLEDVPATIEFDDKGIAGATLNYQVDWDYAPALIAHLFVHPDFPWLVRKSANITREEAWLARCSITFEGVPPVENGEENGRPEYSLEGTTSSEPIETHHRFESKIAGKPSDPRNGAVFVDIATGNVTTSDTNYKFKEFGVVTPMPDHPKAGIKSYEEKSLVYTETRTYSHSNLNTVALNMNKLGEIDTPPSSSILPTTTTGRNWILASCSVVKVGNGMKVTRSWKLSGRKGHDPDIYSSTP